MIRRRVLPAGWYPDSASAVERQCERWSRDLPRSDETFLSAVVPHAGWGYSGKLAFATLRRLKPEFETIVIVGGHLRPDDPLVVAEEDSFETPGGSLQADAALRDWITGSIVYRPDNQPDNTVEVHLPLVGRLFPSVRVVSVRCPPSSLARQLADSIAGYAEASGTSVRVVGSTDLTHYGESYGLTSHGRAAEAIKWVRETNDARIIEALLDLDDATAIKLGLTEHSACSPGAAAAAAAFADVVADPAIRRGELVDYYTSYDVQPNDSFVGYVGIGYG